MRLLRQEKQFLTSILNEANKYKRQDMLMHANADQINALSEMVLNLLKKNIPVSDQVIRLLRPHKSKLRELAKRKHSVKRRREQLLTQQGSGFWNGLRHVFKACHCKNSG